MKRGTVQHRLDNRGNPTIRVAGKVAAIASETLAHNSSHQPATAVAPLHPTDLPAQLSSREYFEAIQAAHNTTVKILQAAAAETEARHKAEVADQQARHDAETARRLVERDSLHLGHIERLLAQAGIERSLWLERVDAAEVRAERVEQRLDQVLDQLLADRRQQVERAPWWRRWFGRSMKSDLGRG